MKINKAVQWLGVGASLVLTAVSSQASFLNIPVPSNAYISQGGYDWAWAGPLPASSGVDLSYQSQFGWHIPTVAELLFAPRATDFLVPGGNVPFGGTDPFSGAFFSAVNGAYSSAQSAGAVAVPYFNTIFHHADWQDGLGQTYGPWAGMPGAFGFADQLVVRGQVGHPTPDAASTMSLLGMGAGLLSLIRRKIQA